MMGRFIHSKDWRKNLNGKGDKQRVKWSKDYAEKHNRIFGCEMCNESKAKRRLDNIYGCEQCNKEFPNDNK